VTSVEVPYSIAAALPSLSVLDITNEVERAVGGAEVAAGIAYVSPNGEPSLVRVAERETGIFCDLEDLLHRLVPMEVSERERLVSLLLGPRSEQIPFADRRLCLGRYQRILLVRLTGQTPGEWTVTLLG
jgi:thiamine phosphate synthase YjbQ (UPF0047 family)